MLNTRVVCDCASKNELSIFKVSKTLNFSILLEFDAEYKLFTILFDCLIPIFICEICIYHKENTRKSIHEVAQLEVNEIH